MAQTWTTDSQSRFHWDGENAWWHSGARLLRFALATNAWTRIGVDAVDHGFDHSCLDHLGHRLFWRPSGAAYLRIYDTVSGAWTQSAANGSTASGSIAIAWHPHLFDDYSVRHRERVSDFNGGVVWYEPDRIRFYDPATDEWSALAVAASAYDGSSELSAVYVRALDAVVLGGGTGGTGKVYRLKHATSGVEAIASTPINFGASNELATMIDDPTGNGILLLEKGASALNRAWRWWSPNNVAAGVLWVQIGDHPFNTPTPQGSWVACTIETESVVMAVCRPLNDLDAPTVWLWRPSDGAIPRFRGV